MDESQEVTEFNPSHSLDYYVKARNGKKRNYIFDYGKASKCDHPTMKIVARGGNMYRCIDCNYVHQWPGAITWPMHFSVIQGAFQIMNFAKEFGMASLGEVLRRPIGQSDSSPHKAVLPEGKSFLDVLEELDEVDTTSEDGGEAQLKELIGSLWESPVDNQITGEHGNDDKKEGEAKLPSV